MRRVPMTLTAALLLCATATAAPAMTPTETVKTRVESALQSLSQTSGGSPESIEQRRVELRRAADSLFDFTEMGRRALGRHWADRTPAEREEFVKLFTDLIARSYIGKIDHYAGETIAYTAERVDGDEASVQSRVVTAKGSQIPVEYRLHRVNDDWSAYVFPSSGNPGGVRLFHVPQGTNQDVETLVFTQNSARLFVRGDLVVNNDNILLSTTDFTSADQDATMVTEVDPPTGGDVNGTVVAH